MLSDEELDAIVRDRQRHWDAAIDALVTQAREANALRAENAELRRDAKRWRKAASLATTGAAPSFAHPKLAGYWWMIVIPREPHHELEQAIDAAISKGAGT
jgi:hypothetical protein